MNLIDILSDFFVFHQIENQILVSGNIWGTSPGRAFQFNLESQKFFDFNQPQHSGQGVEDLFQKRGEPLPFSFKKARDYHQKDSRSPFKNEKIDKIYLDGPILVPPEFVAPACLSLNVQGVHQKIPCQTYTYKDERGRRIGFVLKGTDLQGKPLMRPLSVWNRLMPNQTIVPSYRQKLFTPCVYHLDSLISSPEKAVVVLDSEELVDQWFFQGLKPFKKIGYPFLFTTWPLDHNLVSDPAFWNYLQERENVFLITPQDSRIKRAMSLLQQHYLKKSRIFDGLKDFHLESLKDLTQEQYEFVFQSLSKLMTP